MRVAAADGTGAWHQTLDTPVYSLQPTLGSCVLCATGYAVVAMAGCLHGVRAVLIVFKARVSIPMIGIMTLVGRGHSDGQGRHTYTLGFS